VHCHASSVILSLLRCACGTQQAHTVSASTFADKLRCQTQAWLRVSCTCAATGFLTFCKVTSRWFYWEDPHCRLGLGPCLRRIKQHCVLSSVVQEFVAEKFCVPVLAFHNGCRAVQASWSHWAQPVYVHYCCTVVHVVGVQPCGCSMQHVVRESHPPRCCAGTAIGCVPAAGCLFVCPVPTSDPIINSSHNSYSRPGFVCTCHFGHGRLHMQGLICM
jgi:hypothetical protein